MPPTTPGEPQAATCANCGAPLYGKYCYACGQPAQGLVRHFGSVLSDVADSVLNVDERLFRTLGPLYLRPGRLTLDYFAGRRARYVAPFRLVFFLAIIAFFTLQVGAKLTLHHAATVVTLNSSGVHSAPLAVLPQGPDTHFSDDGLKFNGVVVWNGRDKRIDIGWLPGVVNDWLNQSIGNARTNLHRMNSGNPAEMKSEARLMMTGMLAVAPTVLFVLLPVFALLLKLFYLFKRRLYMEHLIVAMHSHAFLMLSILVLVAIAALRSALPASPWLAVPLSLLLDAAWVWMFAYLFVMQKRVYGQGWLMTAVKFGCIGCCYAVLVLVGMAFAALASLAGA